MSLYGIYYYYEDTTDVILFTISDSIHDCMTIFNKHFHFVSPHINKSCRCIHNDKHCIVWISEYVPNEICDTIARQPYHNVEFVKSDDLY